MTKTALEAKVAKRLEMGKNFVSMRYEVKPCRNKFWQLTHNRNNIVGFVKKGWFSAINGKNNSCYSQSSNYFLKLL